MKNIQNILFIHGFGSNEKSYKGNKLKELFPQYNWILKTFNLLDMVGTIKQIQQLIKENEVDTVVSSSLGCIYNLFIKKPYDSGQRIVNKILINPCCFPSRELPKLDKIPEKALAYCMAMEENIYEKHEENSAQNLFGIFSKDDELLHYHDFFVEKYGAEQNANCIWVEGTHAILSDEVLKESMKQAIKYFDSVKLPEQKEVKEVQNNLANPNEPVTSIPQNPKPILYVDMDGTLVDFESGIRKLNQETLIRYDGCIDETPGIFSLMEPIPGAIDAINQLSEWYDVFILSTAPWLNPSALDDKKKWIFNYFGYEKWSPVYKKVIFSHRKDLNRGDFLVDDRPTRCGVDHFQGTVIPIRSDDFPDWESVLRYLIPISLR